MPRKGENIYKRKDGRWEGRYIKGHSKANKIQYGYIYAYSYKEAKEKLNLAKSRNSKKTIETNMNSNLQYEYWVDLWLDNKKPFVKESTYIRYKNLIKNHIKPTLGAFDINEIDTACIQRFIADKSINGKKDGSGGLSSKSLYDLLLVIKETLAYVEEYYHKANYIDYKKITIKKTSHEMRVLSTTEEKNLNNVLLKQTDRYKLGVLICLYTGIRIGELCALKWKNISLTEQTIKIDSTLQRLQIDEDNNDNKTKIYISEPKTFSSLRTIPFPMFLLPIIKDFQDVPDSFILSGSERVIIEPRTMQNHFKKYLELGGINDANFHSLRHTFATRSIESNFDLKSLSEILGHSSVKITLDKYVHSTMKQKKINMEKIKMVI